MIPPCNDRCLNFARADFAVARKNGLLREVIYQYKLERRRGRCPHTAAWLGCYEWDI